MMNPPMSEDTSYKKMPDPALVEKYRELAYRQYGIHFNGAKVDILRMKLGKMASIYGLDLGPFFDRLNSGDPSAAETFLHEITVGHTFFFREDEHFRFLADDIKSKRTYCPRIWCAASSTGEEPYSIAITMLENGIKDFLVLATDLNLESLRAMHRGVYRVNQFQNMDPHILKSYFHRLDDYTFQIRKELRPYLRIKRLNLHEPIALENHVDYVFCRNVMIYFDEAGRTKVMQTLSNNLKPHGLLFVGHSEAMITLPSCLRKEGPAYYRKAH